VGDREHLGTPNPVDLLHRLGQALALAARHLEESRDVSREALVRELAGLQLAIEVAADAMGTASGGAAGRPSAMWLHGIRNAVTVVAGWAELLVTAREEPRRARARAAIDHGGRLLRERLAQPPG